MYIKEVSLKKIRCFEEFHLKFDIDSKLMPWTIFLGDNATGKTTLLKSIALGLCDESSAAGLLRESDQGYIRNETDIDNAKIIIRLKDFDSDKIYVIETAIEKILIKRGAVTKNYYEKVKQRTWPSYKTFPWSKIFACAYGAGRGTSGTGDVSGYSVINAVYNLFNYSEGLQNPELTLRRITSSGNSTEIINVLQNILFGSDYNKEMIDFKTSGITMNGPWEKNIPLRDLADGYKSTFIWITDFLGWALSNVPQQSNIQNIRGIVLIDEIEQHLHPKWQKKIVNDLKKAFPKVQFIATTHSPLITRSLAHIGYSRKKDDLIHLKLEAKNRVTAKKVLTLSGLDVDQILASSAFDYVSDFGPEAEEILKYASLLASKGKKRSKTEELKYRKLKILFKKILKPRGTTDIEREIYLEEKNELIKEIKELEKKLF